MEITTREEKPEDYKKIHEINHAAFGREKEPEIVEKLRADGNVVISLVAELNNQLVGHIMLSRGGVETEEGVVGIVMIGPVAVPPEFQNKGVGSVLMNEVIKKAREKSETAIILLGHKDYYPRFGFSTDVVSQIESPFNKESFMGLELIEGSLKNLKGKVKYAKAFGLDPNYTL